MEANGLQDSLESHEIQKRKVGLMRARVESEDPSAKVPISLSFSLLLPHIGTAQLRMLEQWRM